MEGFSCSCSCFHVGEPKDHNEVEQWLGTDRRSALSPWHINRCRRAVCRSFFVGGGSCLGPESWVLGWQGALVWLTQKPVVGSAHRLLAPPLALTAMVL